MDRRSFALPLALWYVALVVYASLYPFVGWRSQGVPWLGFLSAPWPQYWTLEDVLANGLGYVPLGFLLTWTFWRSGWPRLAVLLGVLLPSALSLAMEALQNQLPSRVPSQVDWLLNTAGATAGALLVLALGRLGVVARWGQFRESWFVDHARGALVLLALWPAAALYPTPLPFGLGQIWQQTETALLQALADTPFAAWLPASPLPVASLSPLGEAICVALSLLAPCLLGYAVLRTSRQRAWFWMVCCTGAVAVGGLSAGLTYGPAHAWAWLTPATSAGTLAAALLALLALGLSRRTCAVLMLLSLAFALGLLNRAPESPYFAQSLEVWQHGRYPHFHGLSQWLGWLWPYLALGYGTWLASRRAEGQALRH